MTFHTPRAAAEAAFFSHPGNSLEAFQAGMDAYEARLASVETIAPLIFECSTVYARGDIRITVLVKYGENDPGEYYVVNKRELADLKRGVLPETLGLEPVEEEE